MDNKQIKSENIKKIKEYKNQLKSEIFEPENELVYNEEGDAIIDCKVDNLHDLFSPYDISKKRTFCDAFHFYLLDETSIIPLHQNLEIRIHSKTEFTEKEKTQIKRAMKNHFSFYITSDMVKLKRMTTTTIILFALGILSLFAIALFNTIATNIPLYEFLLIMTWFFFWEGTSLGLFDNRKVRSHRYNLLRLYNAKISFINE